MDIKELKKLINEEVKRFKIKEQTEVKKVIYPEDIILTLMMKGDSLPLPENSAVQSAISNIEMKIKLAKERLQIFNKYVPHNATQITMQEVYSSIKDDPQIMVSMLEFLKAMGATESLISNFKQNALSELEQFNTKQPKTNPGTPSAKQNKETPAPVSGINSSTPEEYQPGPGNKTLP